MAAAPPPTFVRQARPLVPSMFMAQEPQMPSRQERRRLSVWSCSSLIFSSTSSIMGPQLRGRWAGRGARHAVNALVMQQKSGQPSGWMPRKESPQAGQAREDGGGFESGRANCTVR